MRKPPVRPGSAEWKRGINAYQRFVAAAHDKVVPEDALHKVRPKRERAPNRAAGKPLENDVNAAVADVLAAHPMVLFAVRQNSGALPYQAASGKVIPVWFYRWVKKPARMRIVDHWGLLTDGRMVALESKRPGWKGPTDQREFEQLEFINNVKAAGGIGGFVTCAEEALALLP